MSKVSLTVELAQELDIKGGRLYGIIKDPAYKDIVREYELDTNQSLLWFDVVQILNAVMEIYEMEDVLISRENLGKVIRSIMKQGKYPYLKLLLHGQDDNEYIGTVFWEIVEDIQLIYDSIAKEKKLFVSQEEITRMVEDKNKDKPS